MATNLVSTIMQSFSPEIVQKLASTLGLEQSTAQKGISAAIPGILVSLANAVSGSDGAQKIGAAMSHAEELAGRGGDIARNALDTNRSALESGWGAISSLLGKGSLETLTSAVAQYAGFGQGTAKKLLGYVVPVVLGFVRREQISSGLDNKGLACLLEGQKNVIERAMPSGLTALLAAPRSQRPNSSVNIRETSYATSMRDELRGSSRSWAYWVLPALIAAGAALYLLPTGEPQRTATQNGRDARPADASQAKPAAPISTAGGMPSPTPVGASKAAGLQNDILTGISRLQVALNRIKDPASAQAAVAEIRDISSNFARLKTIALQLSPEERKAVAAAVSARMPDLNMILDRIGNEINLSGEARPAMDTLKTELASLSKA